MGQNIYNEEAALQLLAHIYHKILRVDLTGDTHEEIKADPEEIVEEKGYSEKISDWLKNFAETDQVHVDDREKYLLFTDMEHLRQAFREGRKYMCCHYRRKMKDGFRWVSMELVPSHEYTHDRQIVLLYIKDIHHQYVKDIEERDILTGGINRRGFIRQTSQILTHAPEDREFAIVFFNLIGFKAINEMFGTAGGDEVLRDAYLHFKESSLCPLLIARIEGDHFVCLVDRANLDYDALPELCRKTIVRNDKSLTVYVKCGVYLIQDRTMEVSAMCDCAKIAKTYIVDEYLKPYAVFDDSMIDNYLAQTEVKRNISSAIKKGEFHVYYQPIFDTRTKELVSAEALVRWIHPERGMISPGVFIPVLEENGFINEIDFFVLDTVKKFLRERKRNHLSIVPVSVNLSWMDFYDTQMMEYIKNDMKGNEDEASMTRLEVTETSYAALAKHDENLIEDLRKLGATILLDDFGSGYSSFSTICDYDFDIIKLDMEFVRRINNDTKIKSIIHSIIDMAHHMDAKVIAEGVETEEQLKFLKRHDCDYVQGFYFSKPLPKAEFEELLDGMDTEARRKSLESDMSITDLIDINILQKIQDSFSRMTGMAALTTDGKGAPVTQGSNFTDFCTRYTRRSKVGQQRCEECDRMGAEMALFSGHACAYSCHAGLMDYAAPIMANGKMVGCFIGGQVLTEEPDMGKVHSIAGELGIPAQDFENAIRKVPVVKKQEVKDAADFLHTFANILSAIAYSKYQLNEGNMLLREKNRQLDFLANHDSLTKLQNRYRMPQIYQEYRDRERPFCVVLGDVDDFKKINDSFGHDCGDQVLKSLADLIHKRVSEKRGSVCRWGGEEILILLPVQWQEGYEIIEALREEIGELAVEYEGKKIRNTMTFGVSASEEAQTLERLVKLADDRMYQGKVNGKNQVAALSAK